MKKIILRCLHNVNPFNKFKPTLAYLKWKIYSLIKLKGDIASTIKLAFLGLIFLILFIPSFTSAISLTGANRIFDEVEDQYPQFFYPKVSNTDFFEQWTYRYYSLNNIYLGIDTDDEVYVLFDDLIYLGTVQEVEGMLGINSDLVVSSMYKFARVTNPKGLAVDQYGNVYIQSQSMLGDGGLLKFNQNGEFLAQNNTLGNGEFRLVVDQVHNVIWAIETSGMLFIVDPNTLYAEPYLNLNDILRLYREPVFDILSKNMYSISMVSPQYGDIGIRHFDNGDFDLLISGQTTAGGNLFVSRLKFDSQSLEVSILVASHPLPTPLVPPPFDTQSSGLAVSNNGTVLTTFTSNIDGGKTPFYLAAFDSDFLSTGTNVPNFLPNFNNTRIYTTGMDASKSGSGYFIVTNYDQFRCSQGASILYVSSNLKNVACIVDLGYTNPNEIAVGPNDKVLYVVMYDDNLVIKINLE